MVVRRRPCPLDASALSNTIECDHIIIDQVADIDWGCTRKKGHKGRHHAHGLNGKCYASWIASNEVAR